jgi:dTDP-4-amino-4,6-dideoxygalactose transaminase
MISLYRRKFEGDLIKNNQSLNTFLPESKSQCRLATGRSAINHLIKILNINNKDSVLLPAYIAEGIIQPFIYNKIKIIFYQLDANLHPDIDNISQIINRNDKIKLCIVNHSMGFEIKIDEIQNILKDKGIYLLEDCAQGLFSQYYGDNENFGNKGDFALFSLNKFIPVIDGAILISHVDNQDVSLVGGLSCINNKAIGAYKRHLEINKEISLTQDPRKVKLLINKSVKEYNIYYDYINSELNNHKICKYSEQIIESYDYEYLIKKRKINTNIIYNNFIDGSIELLYKEYSENIVPMAVPIIINDNLIDYILDELCEKGILLSRQEERWDFLSMVKDEKSFLNEKYFIDNHALIPINEFINEEQILFMVEQLNLISSKKIN